MWVYVCLGYERAMSVWVMVRVGHFFWDLLLKFWFFCIFSSIRNTWMRIRYKLCENGEKKVEEDDLFLILNEAETEKIFIDMIEQIVYFRVGNIECIAESSSFVQFRLLQWKVKWISRCCSQQIGILYYIYLGSIFDLTYKYNLYYKFFEVASTSNESTHFDPIEWLNFNSRWTEFESNKNLVV